MLILFGQPKNESLGQLSDGQQTNNASIQNCLFNKLNRAILSTKIVIKMLIIFHSSSYFLNIAHINPLFCRIFHVLMISTTTTTYDIHHNHYGIPRTGND